MCRKDYEHAGAELLLQTSLGARVEARLFRDEDELHAPRIKGGVDWIEVYASRGSFDSADTTQTVTFDEMKAIVSGLRTQNSPNIYLCRSARSGSTRLARNAGRKLATKPTTINSAETAMRGRHTTSTRIRVNLQHVPVDLRPDQEALDPDDEPNDWAGVNPEAAVEWRRTHRRRKER